MERNESLEMYLETIYLLEMNHGHAHSVDIAKELGVSKPSVSKAMNQLKKHDLICKEVYGTISLSDKGKEMAKTIYRNHKIISLYLQHSLGLSPQLADKNACRMEHIVTDEMVLAIENYLENEHLEFDS